MATTNSFVTRTTRPESDNNPVFEPVLDRLQKMHPGPDNAEYKAFYNEIIGRCVADVAGIVQTRNEELTKPGAELNSTYEKLTKAYSEDQARHLILGNLAGFVKGQVHTPHPTEVFNEKAIEAEEKLVAALLKHKNLFDEPNAIVEQTDLREALNQLSTSINEPLKEPMTIDKEMRRSIRFSQRQFDSLPEIANTILGALNKKENADKPQFKSSDLSYSELKNFAHLIEPQTWSPGDQDSKPDMTADMLQIGTDLNRRAMMFHYFRELTVLGSKVGGLSSDAQGDIQKIMYKLLKTGCEAYPEPKQVTEAFAEKKLLGVTEHGANDEMSRVYGQYANDTLFKNFKKNIESFKSEKAYSSHEELLRDLEKLREVRGIQDIPKNSFAHINSIDTLIIQAMNFKDSSLRIQIRQNAVMHRKVVDNLIDLLPADKQPLQAKELQSLRNHGKVPEGSEAAPDSKGIEALIDAFKTNKDGFADTVKQKVQERLEKVKQALPEITKQMKAKGFKEPKDETTKDGKDLFNALIVEKIGKENYDFYQTMESLGIAAQNPERIQRYLIAECDSKADMLEAFFLLSVMEEMRAPHVRQKVEIVNLVEEPSLVKEKANGILPAADMTSGALKNKYFFDHHMSIKSANHLIEDFTLKVNKDGKLEEVRQPLTVAQVKRAYGYEIKKGDDKRKIVGVKMMMGAGSDITKAGSIAAAAIMMDVMDKTREELLNQNPPVLLQDYIGCGGGVHRTQPVSTSYETVQGRSMRQSAENISQKIIGLLTKHIFGKLSMNPEVSHHLSDRQLLAKPYSAFERKTLARVNMGNMANVAANEAIWLADSRPRAYAMEEKYNAFYNASDFHGMMAFTGNSFVELTQYSARPTKRVEPLKPGEVAKPAEPFPPKVDVSKTRAIGYGAMLNASGSCAGLYYGGSAYLQAPKPKPGKKRMTEEENLSRLYHMYMYDPKAQDTLNRMTYGVVMADMDSAWKYMGHDTSPSAVELGNLAASNPVKDNRLAVAEKALAQVNLEYNEVAGTLLKLHEKMISASKVNSIKDDGGRAAKLLLKTLPSAYREQLEMDRRNIEKPRHELAELFNDLRTGKASTEILNRESKEYQELIYPAMGTIYECFEHTPRALTRPKWVLATEPQKGIV